jgi:hypothetical protein
MAAGLAITTRPNTARTVVHRETHADFTTRYSRCRGSDGWAALTPTTVDADHRRGMVAAAVLNHVVKGPANIRLSTALAELPARCRTIRRAMAW